MGYTVVDCSTVVATHLSQLLKEHGSDLLGHDEVQQLLDVLAKASPKLVENLVPKTLSLGVVLKVMQNLLAERIPIRDVRSIAEALAEHAPKSQEADVLTASVRVALSRTIFQSIAGMEPELQVMTFDPELEQMLRNTLQGAAGGGGLEPGLAESMMKQINANSRRQEAAGQEPVLLVSSPLRLWLWRLLNGNTPNLHVLAYDEVPANKRVKVMASVGREAIALAG